MKRKEYSFVEIQLLMFSEEDVITFSASSLDDQKDNDVTSDDIFG